MSIPNAFILFTLYKECTVTFVVISIIFCIVAHFCIYISVLDYDDHVDAERLSLNCGHQQAYFSSISQAIYELEEPLWNDINKRKLLIRQPELSSNPTSSS
jgi:hypothetical protein